MAQQPLPPPPPTGDFQASAWQRWFTLIANRVSNAGQFIWTQIDKSGSNLTDLAVRNHNDLQAMQGGVAGQYNHLTNAQLTALASSQGVQLPNTFYSGPSSGVSSAPTFRLPIAADIPNLPESQIINLVADLAAKAPNPLTAVSPSIGGTALPAGTCTGATVTVTGAIVGMCVVVTPTTYPGDGVEWAGYVSAANTVIVKVCALVAVTPTASTYNVRVIQ